MIRTNLWHMRLIVIAFELMAFRVVVHFLRRHLHAQVRPMLRSKRICFSIVLLRHSPPQ